MEFYIFFLTTLWFFGIYILVYRPIACYRNKIKEKLLKEELRFFKKYMVRSYYNLEELDYDELTSHYNVEKSFQKIKF